MAILMNFRKIYLQNKAKACKHRTQVMKRKMKLMMRGLQAMAKGKLHIFKKGLC